MTKSTKSLPQNTTIPPRNMPLTHEQDTQLLRILNQHGWNYTVLEHHIPGISRRSLRRAWCRLSNELPTSCTSSHDVLRALLALTPPKAALYTRSRPESRV